MGYFSQKGLFYSFEILQELLSNEILKSKEKDIWGIPPTHPLNPILTIKWESFGEIDSAETRAGKFPLVSMGG